MTTIEREEFLERAAIIEFCGNLSREEAEKLAAEQMKKQSMEIQS